MQPIGKVGTITGEATATHTDGTTVSLARGAPVFTGDVVETGPGATLGLVFVDKTTFALTENARMVLDELIYNPSTNEGSSIFSLVKGLFVTITGEIAKANPADVTIKTPTANIGIRGTEFGCSFEVGAGMTCTVFSGQISVSNAAGQVILDVPGLTTQVFSFDTPPGPPIVLPPAQLDLLFGGARGILSQLIEPGAGGPIHGGGAGFTPFTITEPDFTLGPDPIPPTALAPPFPLGPDATSDPLEVEGAPTITVTTETDNPDDGKFEGLGYEDWQHNQHVGDTTEAPTQQI